MDVIEIFNSLESLNATNTLELLQKISTLAVVTWSKIENLAIDNINEYSVLFPSTKFPLQVIENDHLLKLKGSIISYTHLFNKKIVIEIDNCGIYEFNSDSLTSSSSSKKLSDQWNTIHVDNVHVSRIGTKYSLLNNLFFCFLGVVLLNSSKAALEQAWKRALNRKAFNRTISDFYPIREKLITAELNLSCANLLLENVIESIKNVFYNNKIKIDSCRLSLFEFLLHISTKVYPIIPNMICIFGGSGYMQESPIAQYWNEVFLFILAYVNKDHFYNSMFGIYEKAMGINNE